MRENEKKIIILEFNEKYIKNIIKIKSNYELSQLQLKFNLFNNQIKLVLIPNISSHESEFFFLCRQRMTTPRESKQRET
jgi:hypothetical protein